MPFFISSLSPCFSSSSSITSLSQSMGSSNVAHPPTHTHIHTSSPCRCAASLAEHKRKFKPQQQDDIFTPANLPVKESSVVGRGIRFAVSGAGGFSFQLPCQAVGPSLKDNKALTYSMGRRTRGFSRTQAHSPTKQQAQTEMKREKTGLWLPWVDVWSYLC